MSTLWRWLFAQGYLGFVAVVHYLRLPFKKRSGLLEFQKNYVAAGLSAAPKDRAEHLLLQTPGHCTACGKCDARCPLLVDDEAREFSGPQSFILAACRGTHDPASRQNQLKFLLSSTCQSCQACERACPEAIPILALASLCHDMDNNYSHIPVEM